MLDNCAIWYNYITPLRESCDKIYHGGSGSVARRIITRAAGSSSHNHV